MKKKSGEERKGEEAREEESVIRIRRGLDFEEERNLERPGEARRGSGEDQEGRRNRKEEERKWERNLERGTQNGQQVKKEEGDISRQTCVCPSDAPSMQLLKGICENDYATVVKWTPGLTLGYLIV